MKTPESLRRLTLYSMLLLLSSSIVQAQHPVFDPQSFNSIQRIDSLTLRFLNSDEFDACAESVDPIAIEVTADLFYEKMGKLGSKFDFVYNTDVARQIQYMTSPQSTFMSKCMARKDVYFPIFEEIIDRRKLPAELKYLSVIESALNPNAVSWCGATGLWQFMPGTGKLMNLEISGRVDERKEIIKSTEKALNYLESMYQTYGDWFMALAAYNCGPGNLNKAIRRSGGKTTFEEVKAYLPRETRNYIPKFTAAAFVMNFVDLNQVVCWDENPNTLVPIEVQDPINLKMTAALLQWPQSYVSEYNAHYKLDVVPAQGVAQTLYLPYFEAMKFIEMYDSILAIQERSLLNVNHLGSGQNFYHTVYKGQSLHKIANQYHVTIDDIKRWNKLKGNAIYPGQKLRIHRVVVDYKVPVEPDRGDFKYYVVMREDESLAQVLKNISVADIEKTLIENQLDNPESVLPLGRLIRVFFNSDT